MSACKEYDCFKILTLAKLDNSLSTNENYDMGEMSEQVGVPIGIKWAWVDLNAAVADGSDFGAWVLCNKGYEVSAFVGLDMALKWLSE